MLITMLIQINENKLTLWECGRHPIEKVQLANQKPGYKAWKIANTKKSEPMLV